MEPEILFHAVAGGRLPTADEQTALREWITAVIAARDGQPGPVNYIFCGDEYLHQMNVDYLDHDTLTDIITFPYTTFPLVSGDLFISVERVADNARDLGVSFHDEWHRVIIHGILHLCGQGDKTEAEANEMRHLEDWALSLRPEVLTRG